MSTIAYVGGTFDLFHAGHVNLLKRCAQLCDDVVVALNTDDFCARFKRVPVMTYDERKACLSSCRYVTEVVKNFGEEESFKTIDAVRANNPTSTIFIVHGDDWTGDAYKKQLGVTDEWLEENGITILYLPYTKGISTSEILSRIVDRQK